MTIVAAVPLLSSLARDALASVVSTIMVGDKKMIVDPGTSRDALVDKNPAHLDTRRLEPTPLKDFGVMGLEDHEVDLSTWRLSAEGKLTQPERWHILFLAAEVHFHFTAQEGSFERGAGLSTGGG